MEKGRKQTGVLAKRISSGQWWRWLALFAAGVILAGGGAFLGSSPLGTAALAAISGLTGAAALLCGTVTGAASVGGILPLAATGLFAVRTAIGVFLAWDRRPAFRGDGNHKSRNPHRFPRLQAMVRYTRSSGWQKRTGWQKRSDGQKRTGWQNRNEWQKRIDSTEQAVPVDPDTGQSLPGRRKREPDAILTSHAKNRSADWAVWGGWAEKYLFQEHIFIRMALSALTAMTLGGWSVVNGGFLSYDLWSTIFSVLLSPLLTYLFYAATDRHMRTSAFRETGILASLSLLCRCLSGVTVPLFAFNLGEGAALAAAVLVGSSYGAARGGLTGLACGLLLTPTQIPAFALTGLVTGAFSACHGESVFAIGQGSSRAVGLFAGTVSSLLWLAYAGGISAMGGLVPEVLLVTAALLPGFAYDKIRLPAHWCAALPDTRRSERTAVAEMVMHGREKKLKHLGDGMSALGEMLTGVSEKLVRPSPREMRDLAEDCFAVYCDRCAMKDRCREKEFARWQEMLARMGTTLAEEGGVCGADVPAELGSRCGVMGRVLDEINAAAARRIGERRSGDRLRVAADDYTHMGRLLAESARLEEEAGLPDRELTARLERILTCHDFAAGSVAVYGTRHKRIFVHDIDLSGTRMGGEEIAALFGSVVELPLSVPEFTLDGAVLSMEMHTLTACRCEWGRCSRAASSLGENATFPLQEKPTFPLQGKSEFSTGSVSAPSGDTVAVFAEDGRQYMVLSDGMGTGRMAALTSGMAAVFLERMLTAGTTLETALKMLNHLIRAGCGECAATVDLCEIDLVTLEARFVKSGAAPSFVIRGGSLFRLQSKTVPIGILRALDAELIRFTVEPGDVIVMLSDGIARSFEECPWLLDFLSTDDDIKTGSVQRAAEKIIEQAAARGATDDITAGVMRVL